MKKIKIALVGNPNSGKTTLFNDLTGSNQYVGNWPGVTVEKKEGRLRMIGKPVEKWPAIIVICRVFIRFLLHYGRGITRDFLVLERPMLYFNITDALI